ncbi:MAG: hypothetical protein R3E04_07080 [Sphingobium sp.]
MDSPFFFQGTEYWAEGDEWAHFQWLNRISAVRDIRGSGNRLYLDIDTTNISDEDLRELEAVYRRYSGDLKQLQKLKEALNAQN